MKSFFSIFLLFGFFQVNAAGGYEIKVKLNNYTENTLKLGFHYGNKQYIKDSASINKDGYFVFKGEEELAPGIYLIIMQPTSTYFEMMVVRKKQHFSLTTDLNNIVKGLKCKNNDENELYYEYLNTLAAKKEESAKIKAEMKSDSANLSKYKDKLKKLDLEVDEYQKNLIKKSPESFTAQIIKSSRDIDVPRFEGSDEEVRNKRYFYYKDHFFDNFNMNDEKMIRTPLLFNRVDYYINKLVVQQPDSLIEAVDRVLKLTKPVDDAFKFFCTHFLNFYAKAEYIGQDAVYVHLALNYYNKPGTTPWVDKAQIDKIVENARNLEPTLLGKKAMNFELLTKDNKKVNLYEIKSDYTVLVFWAPDCGHCQKEMPFIVSFWEKWKNNGVELISICNRYTPDKITECWKFVEERPGMKFTTGVDLYMHSNTQANYWVKSTPMIYILDKDKKIVMKKIQAEKLEEIMNEIIEVEAARKLEESMGK
ncbi:MAG: redoxin domain-containing protein [Saprospiraceae bacterium]